MDTSHLEERTRSHFHAEYTDGDVVNSFSGAGGYGHVCYGGIYENSITYSEDDDDDEGEIESRLGLQSLTIYFNPSWLVNRELTEFVLSPEMFGRAFLNTDIDEGLKEGFELDVNLPYHYLLGAMITLRKTFSHPDFAEKWVVAKEICNDPLKALFYADRISETYVYDGYGYASKRESRDSDIFPLDMIVRNLKPPVLKEGTPSTEYLDKDETNFWDVWTTTARNHERKHHCTNDLKQGMAALIKEEEQL